VTFVPKRGATPRVGIVREGYQVVDLTQAGSKPPFDPEDMVSLIAAGARGRAWLRQATARAKKTVPLGKVKLLAPIPRPRKNVFCVGWNYVEHFEESRVSRLHTVEFPAHPTFFSKVPTTVIGPYDAIPFDPEVNQTLDWEAELGVIIGRRGRSIAESDAMKHVFGYTVVNDVSVRYIQRRHGGQWFKGKSVDGTARWGRGSRPWTTCPIRTSCASPPASTATPSRIRIRTACTSRSRASSLNSRTVSRWNPATSSPPARRREWGTRARRRNS